MFGILDTPVRTGGYSVALVVKSWGQYCSVALVLWCTRRSHSAIINNAYMQGYYCRAQVLHCFGLMLRDDPVEAYTSYSKAVEDYLRGYLLSGKAEHRCACHAIIIALEQGIMLLTEVGSSDVEQAANTLKVFCLEQGKATILVHY